MNVQLAILKAKHEKQLLSAQHDPEIPTKSLLLIGEKYIRPND